MGVYGDRMNDWGGKGDWVRLNLFEDIYIQACGREAPVGKPRVWYGKTEGERMVERARWG